MCVSVRGQTQDLRRGTTLVFEVLPGGWEGQVHPRPPSEVGAAAPASGLGDGWEGEGQVPSGFL